MANQIMLSRIPKDPIVEAAPRYVNVSRLDESANEGVEWHQIQRILQADSLKLVHSRSPR